MIYIVSDHAGFGLLNKIQIWLSENKYEFVNISRQLDSLDDYPDRAIDMSKKIVKGDFGVAVCGTGQGICMALNRYKNVRAVITKDESVVKLTREHNDANVICFAGRFDQLDQVILALIVFLNTKFSGEDRHLQRIAKIS